MGLYEISARSRNDCWGGKAFAKKYLTTLTMYAYRAPNIVPA
jgi:hypothetical protein